MRSLSPQENRTIRIAGTLLAIYLVLFYGVRGWKHLEARRNDYQKLVQDAQTLKQELRPYENKALLIEDLKQRYHLDFTKLSKTTLVAQASAAIQQAAQGGGVQLGPLRETSARASAKELASMQLEAMGPVPALSTFLHRLETLGYPLIIDALQITAEPSRPGMIKINVTLVILDYDQFKAEDAHHA